MVIVIKKYDKEYSTSYHAEYLFLKEHGVKYSWVYQNEDGVTVWKYKKSAKLFEVLTKFYKNVDILE